MSTGNHTKKALEIWKASFGSETIIFTVWLHLPAWCFELIWRITKTTDDLPSTRLSLWPTKAMIIGWQLMDTEAPQAMHCYLSIGLSGMLHCSFLYFALRMTGNIRVISERLLPKNLVEDCRKSRIPTLKLIRFSLQMTNLSWSIASRMQILHPIRYFNFQFIANQDCFFQHDTDIKFLLTLLTKNCVLAYHSIFFPDRGIFSCALLKISAPCIFPTMQYHLHSTDYDVLLEALLPGSFSVSNEMLLIFQKHEIYNQRQR